MAICFASLACLLPATFYLVNKKPHPTVVSGRWDFVLVLAALSGFLLVGGALLLTLVQSDTRFVLRGNFEHMREGWGENSAAWLFVAVGYLLLVVGASALTLTNRSRWLSVYNIEVAVAERAVGTALERSGIRDTTRYGNRWTHGPAILEIVPFRGMGHVTIQLLSASSETRAEIERHLRSELVAAASADNGAAAWLGTLAATGVLLNLCLVGMALYFLYFR